MWTILKHTFLFSGLLLTVKIEANRRGWGGGWGGNRGNRWKQVGSGGFNSWRQQTFKHNNKQVFFNINNEDVSSNNRGGNNFTSNDQQYLNGFGNPEYHGNSKPDSDLPTIGFSHNPSQTSCAIPTMGDSSKFELRCIFPNSEQNEDCTAYGSFLPSGTSVMLHCKPPYVSETGDLRIWVCEDGVWKGEFKSFICTMSITTTIPIYVRPDGIRDNNKNLGSPWSYKHNGENIDQVSAKPDISWQQVDTILDLIPGLLDKLNVSDKSSSEFSESGNTTAEETVRPPWHPVLEKWRPSTPSTTTSTTTTLRTTTTLPTTTTTTTTPQPSSYRPVQAEDPPKIDWNTYFSKKKEENAVKCPPLSKRNGIYLECLSKSPVPWDPSSFLVSQNDCSTGQVVGTEATYKCEQYYEANLGLTIQYRKCKDDGTWTGGENRFSCALECGKSNPIGRIPLITNGEPTYKAQWPWHAALFYQDDQKEGNQYDYNCGATLINRKVVLTAAHCVTEFYSKSIKSVTQFRIDLGRFERTVDDEYVQTFTAEDIIPHPSYNPISFDSDIAIIILKGSATVGFHVRPICYPQTQNSAFEELHLSDGSYGTVVGFGKNENGDLSDSLHMARLKVVSQQECSESFADTNFGATLTKSTTFCAGLKNGTNVCSGDSGGGIYFPVSSGGTSRWYLQGVVSVGITSKDGSNKCDPTRFSVFTRISPYADWIVRVLSEKDAL